MKSALEVYKKYRNSPEYAAKRAWRAKMIGSLLFGCLMLAVCARAQNSTVQCLDNSTLREVISVDLVNASNVAQTLNSTAYTLQVHCQDGCDNTTQTCNPAPLYQNLMFMGAFVAVIVLIVAIGRWLA